jgi:DNA primase
MIYPPSFLDELRQRIPLSSQVSKVTKLIRKGREYMGCCPFHKEKTPSFSLNDEKGLYYCFGCGAKGDLFDFCSSQQGLSFTEVVQSLAQEAGLPLPEVSEQTREDHDQRQKLYTVLEEACRWFEGQLWETAVGEPARSYLDTRGVDPNIRRQFRLGFAPSNNGLQNYLLSKGFSQKEMLEAGLLGHSERPGANREIYERFRNRIIFPIQNIQGRVVAFGGRILGDGKPKYLNSPETPVFQKRQLLYGLPQALGRKDRTSDMIVCEGYMDVISLSQHGFQGSVAPLGTALTLEQLKLLWRKTETPIVCFDGDAAGERAANRCLEIALPALEAGKGLRFIHLPNNEDPDTLLSSGSGGQATFSKLVQSAQPLSKVLWNQLLKTHLHSGQTPEALASLKKGFSEQISRIQDLTIQRCYKENYWQRFQALTYSNKKKAFLKNTFGTPHTPVPKIYNAHKARLKVFLACLINHPRLFEDDIERLAYLEIPKEWAPFFNALLSSAEESSSDLDSKSLKTHLIAQGFKKELAETVCEETYVHGRFSSPNASYETAHQGYLEILALLTQGSSMRQEVTKARQELEQSMALENWEKLRHAKGLA